MFYIIGIIGPHEFNVWNSFGSGQIFQAVINYTQQGNKKTSVVLLSAQSVLDVLVFLLVVQLIATLTPKEMPITASNLYTNQTPGLSYRIESPECTKCESSKSFVDKEYYLTALLHPGIMF